jgi:hypothetical protein
MGAVPARVWPVIAAHIAALDQAGRAVLERAAVVGRRFALAILSRMGLKVATLNAGLRQLETAGLIELDPQGEEGTPVYRFRHNFTHKVAYETLSEADRRQYHLAVVEAIEALYPDHRDRWAIWLAHHRSRALVLPWSCPGPVSFGKGFVLDRVKDKGYRARTEPDQDAAPSIWGPRKRGWRLAKSLVGPL